MDVVFLYPSKSCLRTMLMRYMTNPPPECRCPLCLGTSEMDCPPWWVFRYLSALIFVTSPATRRPHKVSHWQRLSPVSRWAMGASLGEMTRFTNITFLRPSKLAWFWLEFWNWSVHVYSTRIQYTYTNTAELGFGIGLDGIEIGWCESSEIGMWIVLSGIRIASWNQFVFSHSHIYIEHEQYLQYVYCLQI